MEDNFINATEQFETFVDNNAQPNEPDQFDQSNDILQRHVGQVKWFDKSKGYGFITDTDNKVDYFVHHSALKNGEADEYAFLVCGEYVEYDLTDNEQPNQPNETKTTCVNVTGIRNGPLMFQVIRSNRLERMEHFMENNDGYQSVSYNRNNSSNNNRFRGGAGGGGGRGRGNGGRIRQPGLF